MKKLFLRLILVLLLVASSVFAQNTVVTATITDPTSQAFINGTAQADFQRAPNHQGSVPINTVTGLPIVEHGTSLLTTMNGSGQFTLTLANLADVAPTGGTWVFTLCPFASSGCQQASSQAVIGASVNLSTALSNQMTTITVAAAPIIPRAYVDTEITTGIGSEWLDVLLDELKYINAANVVTTISGGVCSGCITGSGTSPYLPVWTGTATQGNSNLQQVTSPNGLNYTTGSGQSVQLDTTGLFWNTGVWAGAGGSVVIQNIYSPPGGNNAGGIVLEGAPATGSACAGNSDLQGASSNSSNNGGHVLVYGGCTNGFGAVGANIDVTAGSTSASNNGGNVNISAGTGGFANGAVNITGNTNVTGNSFLGGTVGIGGVVSSFNGKTTVRSGVASELVAVDVTSQQTAAISATTLILPDISSDIYTLTYTVSTSQAATSSSTLGPVSLICYDPDIGSNVTIVGTSSTGNTIGTAIGGVLACNTAAHSTESIKYSIGYTSSGATPLGYVYHLTLSKQ